MQFSDPSARTSEWKSRTEESFNTRAIYHDIEFVVGKESKSFYSLKGELARHSQVFAYVNYMVFFVENCFFIQ